MRRVKRTPVDSATSAATLQLSFYTINTSNVLNFFSQNPFVRSTQDFTALTLSIRQFTKQKFVLVYRLGRLPLIGFHESVCHYRPARFYNRPSLFHYVEIVQNSFTCIVVRKSFQITCLEVKVKLLPVLFSSYWITEDYRA